MLAVNTTPFSLPLNTAHVPTESMETQNRFAERIPESVPAFESEKNKGSETDQQLADADRSEKNAEMQGRIIGSKDENSDKQTEATKQDEQQQKTNTSQSAKQEQQQEIKDQAVIRELSAIDRQVKAHEQAHSSVGGVHAGSPNYTYKTGPNGVRYAIAGEVPIDLASVPGNPQATLSKAEQVSRAALAPADPSPTDRQIAASAQALATRARFEIARLAAEKLQVSRGEISAKINGEDIEQTNSFESTTSFAGGKLHAALATDATEQVGGQVSASA